MPTGPADDPTPVAEGRVSAGDQEAKGARRGYLGQGRPLPKVPDVLGVPLVEALQRIRDAGLETGTVLYRKSEPRRDAYRRGDGKEPEREPEDGTILEQQPAGGTTVYFEDAKVNLWVLRNRDVLAKVPDVLGLSLRKALQVVRLSGMEMGAVLYRESYEAKDTILEQDPKGGRMVSLDNTKLTLWVARESYVKWLPAIYQRSDALGRNFIRDVLWIVQHLFGSIEEQLDSLHQYFDPFETPERFLPWLGGWSAMRLEVDWPTSRKRRLIKNAIELYRWRGTVKGLGLFIKLFTGFEPTIIENEWPFAGWRVGVDSAIGMDTVVLPPVEKEHAFIVVMPHEFKDLSPEAIIRLQEIIELEKPANSSYMLKFAEPGVSVEERTFYHIGVRSGVDILDEIVVELPKNEQGEPQLPQVVVEPPVQPDPSVYELFGTKKRQLPEFIDVPDADKAPVEGQEIIPKDYGFGGVQQFNLDDIMEELLRSENKSEGGSDGGDGKPE